MAGKGSPKGVKQGGRKPGTPNKVTAEIKTLAREYTEDALKELARLATGAESEQARVSAIKELFDRAYGKATQLIGGDPDAAAIKTLTEVRNTIVDPRAKG